MYPILEADGLRLGLDTNIFEKDIGSPVNAYLDISVKNDDYSGSVKIAEPYGHNGYIEFTADKNGHIEVKGRICTVKYPGMRKNELYFEAGADQSFFREFIYGLYNEYSEYSRLR